VIEWRLPCFPHGRWLRRLPALLAFGPLDLVFSSPLFG
jgi:hypothetical protein